MTRHELQISIAIAASFGHAFLALERRYTLCEMARNGNADEPVGRLKLDMNYPTNSHLKNVYYLKSRKL